MADSAIRRCDHVQSGRIRFELLVVKSGLLSARLDVHFLGGARVMLFIAKLAVAQGHFALSGGGSRAD